MNDPIVQDVRNAREQLAGKFDYDLHKIFGDIRRRQKSLGGRLISAAMKAPPGHLADKAVGG